MKKGFTLIELLAVIVILAIIALIATPIVLNIINDAKESATLRLAEFYLKGVETSIASAILKNKNITDNTYNIKDGDICLNDDCTDKLEVEVDGKTPEVGTITITNGNITGLNITLEEKEIYINSKGELVYLKKLNDICKPAKKQLYATNPLEAGYEYECEVKPGIKYNFYVLNTRNKAGEIIKESSTDKKAVSINLIMAQNINSDGTPTTKAMYEGDKDENGGIYNAVAYNIDGDAADVGPVTAMNFLNSATSNWENIQNLDITYNDEGENFNNFKITGKARLPYKSEVNNVGCLDDRDFSCPVWMVDYLNDAGLEYDTTYQENAINGIWGYLTFSSRADDSSSAWYVHSYGGVGSDDNPVDTELGARPVINLKI